MLLRLLITKKFTKQSFIFSQNIILKSFFFYLIISTKFKQLRFKSYTTVLINNDYLIFTKKTNISYFLLFFKKLNELLLLGFHARFRILGLGYRFWIFKNVMVFEIGRTHRKYLKLRGLIGIVRKKLNFIVFSFSKHSINMFCVLILNLRKISPFKPKGLLPIDQEILKKPMVVSNR